MLRRTSFLFLIALVFSSCLDPFGSSTKIDVVVYQCPKPLTVTTYSLDFASGELRFNLLNESNRQSNFHLDIQIFSKLKFDREEDRRGYFIRYQEDVPTLKNGETAFTIPLSKFSLKAKADVEGIDSSTGYRKRGILDIKKDWNDKFLNENFRSLHLHVSHPDLSWVYSFTEDEFPKPLDYFNTLYLFSRNGEEKIERHDSRDSVFALYPIHQHDSVNRVMAEYTVEYLGPAKD